jgi:hypothetical protein
MKRLAFALIAVFVCAAGTAQGQERAARGSDRHISLGELTPTPEMWFYEQAMRQYENPKMAVRRKAEYRAAQRQARLAASRWFGFSNSRPMAAANPMFGTDSPRWGSNSWDPLLWRGVDSRVIYQADNGFYGGLR